MVEAEEGPSRMIVIGRRPAPLRTPRDDGDGHPGFPYELTYQNANLILTPEEIADVSAYILSLRDHP